MRKSMLVGVVLVMMCGSARAQERTELLFHPRHDLIVAEARFEQLMCGVRGDEEAQPDREHDPLPDHKDPMPFDPNDMPLLPVERRFEPSFVASDTCGVIVLVVGMVGWIALGIAVLVLEWKPKPAA